MKLINYTEVPTTEAEDINREKTTWRNGECVMIDEGPAVTLYLGHRQETRLETDPATGEETTRTVTLAFPVRLEKPLTRDMAINAAEMAAYGLRTPMEVASFGASLARKFRESPEDAEIREHDDFIAWVKDGLTAIGLGKAGAGGSGAGGQSATFADAFSMMRLAVGAASLDDAQSLQVKSLYPAWEDFIGKPLPEGRKVRYGGELYAVRQDIAVVLENQPPSTDTLALYRAIEEAHGGTADDPVPYRQNMALEPGKYYVQDGVKYVCTQAMQPMPYDLKDLAAHVEVVK